MEGTTIVVSPLLALQADQTIDLNNRGINSACLNSTTGKKETAKIIKGLKDKTLKLLYIAPETLLKEDFLEFLQIEANINHIAIDESHALVQSSQDFRPKYRQLSILREYFPDQPYTALTATATPEDIEEISESLRFREDYNLFKHNLHRQNLRHNVKRKFNEIRQLMEIVTEYPKGTSGIVYCNTKKKCEAISSYLEKNGYKSAPFYSTISKGKKKEVLDKFLSNDVDIVVATSAFGTGINKSNIRFIINIDIPASMNDLLQQCIPLDSIISTDKGYKKAIDVDINKDKLLTFNEVEGICEYKEIIKTIHGITNQWYLFKTKKGRELRVTAEHPIYVINKFIKASDVKVEDIIQLDDGKRDIIDSVSIIEVHKESTINFTVKDNNNYYVNNILTHNCGRSGRDGEDSDTYVLYSLEDASLLKYIFRMSYRNPARLQKAYDKVDEVLEYLQDQKTCRSLQLLNAYGQQFSEGIKSCGVCDNCKRYENN